ncbi:MAG TPA: GGDEF domain-containing protein [Thermoanaerobaculia bacterium]
MELLLWRWSTSAQIASGLMIAVFFLVLASSVRRVELRPWVNAWLANLAALLVTSIFWFAQPQSPAAFIALRFGYFFSKTMFVVLLALGAWAFVRRGVPRLMLRPALIAVAVYSIAAALLVESINGIGVVQSAVIGLMLASAAALLLVRRVPGSGWLAGGLSLRAVLAIVEAAAYATRVVPNGWSKSDTVAVFLASHSSFDTGAEWVIALGCVLTLYRTIQEELTRTNADLLAAQEVLQELVDRDPLTGLSNRRALPGVLRESFATGATILFFDLNDFKEINDSYGHHAGDECLRHFAKSLQKTFPADAVIRYAGDEFVVVARGVELQPLLARVEGLRDRLKFDRSGMPPIRFSVGHAELPVNGEPDDALRAADAAMYRDKANKTKKLQAIR